MKVYGNSKGDGFTLLCAVVGGLFVLGGAGLSFVGGITLLAGIPAMVVVTLVMLQGIKRWDVMSEVAQPGGVDTGVPVRLPNSPFVMPAVSDVVAQPARAPWSPTPSALSILPAKVETPKPAIETNTPVA